MILHSKKEMALGTEKIYCFNFPLISLQIESSGVKEK